MARIRSIKPGFFTNDQLAEIDPLGRLLFAGLWCHADRAGRLEDRPRKIKAEVLPYDDCDVDALLDDLVAHGFIVRYQANGTRYIQVVTFHLHQTPNIKEVQSTIPAPHEHPTPDIPAPSQHSASTVPARHLTDLLTGTEQEQVQEQTWEGVQGEPSGADAPVVGEGEDGPVDDLHPAPKQPRELPGVHAERFDAFWDAYPKKVGKKACQAWWKNRRPSAELAQTIVDSIEAHRLGDQWQRGFIKDPLRWLQEERWSDEIPPPGGARTRANPNGRLNGDDAATEAIRLLRGQGRDDPADLAIEATYSVRRT